MPLPLKTANGIGANQINLMGLPYKGTNASTQTLDLKNRRVISNTAPPNSPRSYSTTISELVTSLSKTVSYKNKIFSEIFFHLNGLFSLPYWFLTRLGQKLFIFY